LKKIVCLFIILIGCLYGCAKSDPQVQKHTESTKETTEATMVTLPEQETQQTESTEPTPVETCPIIIPNKDDLVKIEDFIPNIIIDLKYATADNFTGQIIYDQNMPAMLRYGTVEKLADAQDMLNKIGYTLVILDAYRPPFAQFKLWETYPDSRYVANPMNGHYSSHSKGNTVDVTVVKLDQTPVEMPTEFDDFSKKADRNYDDVSEAAKGNAQILEDIMKECGFEPYSAEWWHFTDTDNYEVIQDSEFEESRQ
jgi:D-alanyl-D-alanine dipeptidase